MKAKRWNASWVCSATLLAGVAGRSAPAIAETRLPEQFTLARYVPDDCWFYVHAVHNPEREWIDQQWASVFETAKQSGIDKDLAALFFEVIGPERRAEIEPKLERILNILRSVRWTDLCNQEFVVAERLSSGSLAFDYIFLTRAAEGTGEAHFTTLEALLKELSTMATMVRLEKSSMDGLHCVSLAIEKKDLAEMGAGVAVFRRGDIIGLSTGQKSTEAVRALLGNAGRKSMATSARFAQALAGMEPPSDSVVYVDTRRLFGDVRKMMDAAFAAKQKAGECQDAAADAASAAAKGTTDPRKFLGALIDLADVVDYSVETSSTRGNQSRADSALVMQPGKENSPVAAAFLNRKAFEKFDRFIPAEAKGFSLSAGVDLPLLYATLADFLQKNSPEAAMMLAKVHEKLAQIGIDLQRDVFAWWSGETITIELPAAMVSPMGGADSVFMLRVKDRELATAKINGGIDFVLEKLKAQGQPLMVSPAASVKSEGFREITHPALAIFMRPVIGFHGDWLMVGSSAGAINKCLAVQAGEAPSIAENQKFKAEGLTPVGPVLSASFTDKSKMGQELAAAVGMAGMVGQMMAAQVPAPNEEAQKAKKTVQSLLQVAAKLGPILQKVDFYSSSSSVSTFDGERTTRVRSLTTYKGPQTVANQNKQPK